MNTAAPTLLQKRICSILLVLTVFITSLPTALALDMNVDAGFYFKQSRSNTCTLTAAAMMLRRYAYFNAMDGWTDVTENSLRSTAWYNGLSHDFTYKEMQVGYATLPSNKEEKTRRLIELLDEHPEGIVLYNRKKPHAVLLTDYTNGVFYCADPANNNSSGRIPLSNTTVSVSNASCYWYVVTETDSIAAAADGLRLEGMSYPVNVKQGHGVSLTGAVSSATGTTLSEVEIIILDADDQTVQSASAQMNVESWSFKTLDSKIHFGQLPEGCYTYMVMVTDSEDGSLCFVSEFTVSGDAAVVEDYWSVYDAEGSMLVIQEEENLSIEDVVEESAQARSTTLSNWLKGLVG